jgi:hypothetical protein
MKAFALFLASLTVVPVMPAQSPSSSAPKKNVGTEVKDVAVDYYDSMSDYFRQSRRAVMLISEKGIPDLEIPAVLLIARRSSASPNQIIADRKGGKDWAQIAKANNVTLSGTDFASEANLVFLSEYHGRPVEEIRAMHAKGASYIDINQELRRSGSAPMKPKTAK